MKKTIGIIGYGNMGSAIAERIKRKYRVFVFDKDKEKTKNLKNITRAADVISMLEKTDVIILAVKPQNLDAVLNEIKDYASDKLIVSIAAAITTGYIERVLGKAKIIRVMPNLPARIGKGMTCLSRGKRAGRRDLDFTQRLFTEIGKTMIIKEEMMDADTAVSGSGPGYYYKFCPNTYDARRLIDFENNYFIPSLSSSAQAIGFSKEQADFLAKTTAEGSRILFIEVKGTPVKLRKQVASKGGTTQAAFKVFQKYGSRKPDKKVWIQAVKAAKRRAEELSKS